MVITELKIDGFRNLEDIYIKPDEKYNLIIGDNAQGKTNILEAVWALTGCKSFRGSKEKDYICFDKQFMNIEMSFIDSKREQKITYALGKNNIKEKKITLNGVPLKHSQRLFESFKCVVFTPNDTELVKGPPDKRRSFIDLCHSQISHGSLKYIRQYETIISQRNAALKDIFFGKYSEDILFIWDEQLANICAYISIMRNDYIEKLNKYCKNLYSKITGGKEDLSVSYSSNAFDIDDFNNKNAKQMAEEFFIKLRNNSSDDVRLGFTQNGVHRDDIILKINGLSVKEFGSQGQQKSTALVLKLAQAGIYYENKNDSPIILLDDVMGELDINRQNLVYEIVKDMQVFITSCNKNAVEANNLSRVFHVENGGLV